MLIRVLMKPKNYRAKNLNYWQSCMLRNVRSKYTIDKVVLDSYGRSFVTWIIYL